MARNPKQFLISVVTIDWNSNALPEGVYFKKLKSPEVSGFSETPKGKDWRKGSRGRTELAVHLKTISTEVLA